MVSKEGGGGKGFTESLDFCVSCAEPCQKGPHVSRVRVTIRQRPSGEETCPNDDFIALFGEAGT